MHVGDQSVGLTTPELQFLVRHGVTHVDASLGGRDNIFHWGDDGEAAEGPANPTMAALVRKEKETAAIHAALASNRRLTEDAIHELRAGQREIVQNRELTHEAIREFRAGKQEMVKSVDKGICRAYGRSHLWVPLH